MHEPLTRRDVGWRMLAVPRGSDVGHSWQCPMIEIVVVLAERNDVRRQARVVEKPGQVQYRHINCLGDVIAESLETIRDAWSIVLHVELPRDPGSLQPVEDRGYRQSARGDTVTPADSARGSDPKHVVGHAAGIGRSELVVE